MSDNNQSDPVIHSVSPASGPIRIINNAAIRERAREEVLKSKRLKKKKKQQELRARERDARRTSQEQLAFARGYITRANTGPLGNPLLAPGLAAQFQNQLAKQELDKLNKDQE